MTQPNSPPIQCIGIDLGTTNSVVAYYNAAQDQIEIIPNSHGDRLTPSCVLFSDNEVLVGQLAIEAKTENQHLISHVKRFIGQKQQQCQEALTNLEYDIEIDHNGYPMIPITFSDGINKKFKPEEISSHILHYLKTCAEEHIGTKITEAVITVPAYFNDSQRRATKDACTIAGLKCLRLVAEPTAACLCYGLHRSQKETVLVFDLGGGTLDVSILKLLNGGIFQVLGTSGNTQLGGADIDYLLMQHLREKYSEFINSQNKENKENKENKIEKVEEDNKDEDLPLSDRFNQAFVENIKKILSNVKQTTVRLPNDFKYILTRSTFEMLIHDFVESCLEPIDQVLKDTNLTTSEISQIVLVGGSTRIPLIQEKLKQLFGPDVPLNKSVNPDEAVAYGAAVQASIQLNVGSKAKSLLLLDVTPLSLGIETSGGVMNAIIKRNSTLPCEVSKVYSTVEDNQESVEINVYQGERQFTTNCIKLATFTLEGLPKRPRGVPKIKVTFKLNCDGLLEVEAVDKNTGLANSLSISAESNLTDLEIQRLLTEAEQFRAKDHERRQAMEEISRFEKYIYEIQRLVNLPEMKTVLDKDWSSTNQYLMNTIDWIMANRSESLEVITNSKATVEYNLKPYLDMMYSHRQQMKQSGIKLDEGQKTESGVEHIDQLIEDICGGLK